MVAKNIMLITSFSVFDTECNYIFNPWIVVIFNVLKSLKYLRLDKFSLCFQCVIIYLVKIFFNLFVLNF